MLNAIEAFLYVAILQSEIVWEIADTIKEEEEERYDVSPDEIGGYYHCNEFDRYNEISDRISEMFPLSSETIEEWDDLIESPQVWQEVEYASLDYRDHPRS